jgi:hypothetical protein
MWHDVVHQVWAEGAEACVELCECSVTGGRIGALVTEKGRLSAQNTTFEHFWDTGVAVEEVTLL